MANDTIYTVAMIQAVVASDLDQKCMAAYGASGPPGAQMNRGGMLDAKSKFNWRLLKMLMVGLQKVGKDVTEFEVKKYMLFLMCDNGKMKSEEMYGTGPTALDGIAKHYVTEPIYDFDGRLYRYLVWNPQTRHDLRVLEGRLEECTRWKYKDMDDMVNSSTKEAIKNFRLLFSWPK